MKPEMHFVTAWRAPVGGSRTARRMGDHHCALRPEPCQAAMGIRSMVSEVVE